MKFYKLALPLVASFGLLASASVMADTTEAYKISQGGKIYDNWSSALMVVPPSVTHISYPADAKKSGKDTWRCKECHGWDYKGVNGAYSGGSHRTGIKGVEGVAGKSVESISAMIRNKTHGYTKAMISDEALSNLALFLSKGMVDPAPYIVDKVAKGDKNRGKAIYETVCSACHGLDGKLINFGGDKIEVMGTVAAGNPWEVLHKLLNGQPGAPMPALRALALQDALDVLAYTQTLPQK